MTQMGYAGANGSAMVASKIESDCDPGMHMVAPKKRKALENRPLDWQRLARQIGEVVDSAAFDPKGWVQVADALQGVKPDLRVAIQAHDLALPQPVVLIQSGWSQHWLDVYVKHFASVNDVAKAWPQAPELVPMMLPDAFIPVERYLKTEFYNDGLRLEGGADAATGVKFFNEDGRQAAVSLQYGWRHQEAMHEALSPLLAELAPRMRRALHLNRVTVRIRDTAPSGDLIYSLLDPALLVDDRGRVVASNSQADSMLNARHIHIGAHDKLSFGNRHTDAKFRAMLRSACGTMGDPSGFHELRHESKPEEYIVSILPMSQNLRSLVLRGMHALFAPGSLALVVLRGLQLPTKSGIEGLRSRYGLTIAEVKMADALRQGGSVVEIADRLGIAYDTARNQLKAAFAKTGTHSQRELLHLLLQLSTK
jgi:DNA-binding CsgD family transcriptional regulator